MTIRDDGETTALFEPLMISESSKHRSSLNDLALELARRSEGFRRSLPPSLAVALADLVCSMNCYYSNLIEGHNTHPIDIERALENDYSTDPKKRNLQLEAKAHINVQKWIDEGGIDQSPASKKTICEIHQRFCKNLPEELLIVENPATGNEEKIVPGQLRELDVEVGYHRAISPGAVPRFMQRFEQVYSKSGRIDAILSAACAHHRLLWIHPFLDGNGRVARLMSYAILQKQLDTQGLWSVSRGLARQEKKYKQHLAACDLHRRNDLDGRGTLSEEELASFTGFFLETCIDQVDFMEKLMQPERLKDRIMIWCEEQIREGALPAKSDIVLQTLLYRGELGRSEVAGLIGLSDRAARRITSALEKIGAITSKSTRAPFMLSFPAKFADRWMPGLFPDK